MTAQIMKALSGGFTSKQVIQYLMKQFPQHKDKIEKALAMGFGADQIVKILTKGQASEEQAKAITEHEKTGRSEQQRKENINKTALAVAGTTAAAASPYIMPRIAGALSGLLPGHGGQPTPTMQQPPMGQQGIQPTPSPMQQTPGQTVGAQVQQPGGIPNVPVPPTQAQLPQQPGPSSIFEGILQKNNPKNLSEDQTKQLQSLQRMSDKLEKEGRPPNDPAFQNIEKKVRDVIKGRPGMSVEEISRFEEKYLPKEQPESNLVMTKSGDMGEVKGADTSGQLIDVDGKVKKFKDEDIVESPIPQKDLADLYTDLIKGIGEEGEEVSKNVYWAGYDPKTNELMYIPHDGGAYVYDNISPEDAKALTEMLTTRKSTGENYIGAWTKGTKSPIGAAMHALIVRLQKERGGKGNEYVNRFDTIYDALELAKKAAKKKYAKKK